MTRRSFLAAAGLATPRHSAEWIALDLPNQSRVLHWASLEAPLNLGSLLKPFLVLGYAATHARFPDVECLGSRSGCWHLAGHGRQNVVAALANSCNTYFRSLVGGTDRAALDAVCLVHSLRNPDRRWNADRLIGLGAGWPQAPLDVAQAFAAFPRNRSAAGAQLVLAGMARCARSGTAREVGFPCYAKTGTAPCSHTGGGSADGFALALYPLDQPRKVMLVRGHNLTGAETARDIRALAARSL